MMMALGMFVFALDTLAYQELERVTNWRHAKNQRVNARDAFQYIGVGEDTITLNGWIAPEFAGTALSFDALRTMADTGRAWHLIRGTGRVYGTFIIASLREGQSHLDGNGNPKKIEFTITLERTDSDALALVQQLGSITSINELLDMSGISAVNDSVNGSVKQVTGILGGLV